MAIYARWFAVIGAFRSSLLFRLTDDVPSKVRFCSIYEQKDGAAMGSPVSAIIANIFMEDFEERAIASAIHKPKIWKRCVDDIFTILDQDQVDGFLQHLNNQQPTIRFTMQTKRGIFLYGIKSSLSIVTLTDTHAGSKRLSK